MEDFTSLSDEEFMDAWTALGTEVQAGRDRLKEFSLEHQRRERKAQLALRNRDLSEEDMALLQEVRAEGIASAETVGAPGGEEQPNG